MNETAAPYFWLRRIDEKLRLHDAIPLFGNTPPFDLEKFSTLLSDRFAISHPLQIRFHSHQWKSEGDLKEGLGIDPFVLSFNIGSMDGMAFWIMPKEEAVKLSTWMLNGKTKERPLSSEILVEGFYRYLTLETLDVISQIEPFVKTAVLLNERTHLPEGDVFCIDVETQFENRTCMGKLAIDAKLQQSWAQHFSGFSDSAFSKINQLTEIDVGVKVGSSSLSLQEWEGLKKGDFLLLEKESYDARKKTGVAFLMLGSMPLFTVRIKQNKLLLLEYAFTTEEDMEEPNENKENLFSASLEQLPSTEETPIALKNVPVQITVEIARFHMTLEKLMQLTPGNFIELPIHPDQAVKLTVNGKTVGKAELVHLGEALGVRILELG